jgi:hypothetical protein
MNWKTIYLKGKEDFWEDVNDKLSRASINCLAGNLEQLPDGTFQGIYWLDDRAMLRDLKLAVSAKLIWRYRLQFFAESEIDKTNLQNNEMLDHFTERERKLIQKMRSKNRKRAAA